MDLLYIALGAALVASTWLLLRLCASLASRPACRTQTGVPGQLLQTSSVIRELKGD